MRGAIPRQPTKPRGETMTRSPLRYPGGRSRAVKHIIPLIPKRTKRIASPFLGGGSVELACADLGMKVWA